MTQDPTITRAPEPGAGITHSVVEPITSTGVDAATSSRPTGPASSDRYLLGDEIARGGMGVVYCATDTAFGREVAVKVLLDKYGPASGAARRFADEARITGQLQHPAIPPVHDLGTLPDGRPFLAMKLIKGRTLDELLKDRADLAAERGRFVAAFESVCQAVAYAHAHQVIHRDLKPANVMVGSFGEVQVMDWGLAKVLTTRERPEVDPDETHGATEIQSLRDSDGSFTQAGSVLGTLAFMAPEQAVGAIGQVDLRSDVFGLGAILAVILTGQPPFAASSAETTRVQAAQGNVEGCFARLDASGADPDLVALCKRCLSPKPEDRPADAGRVAAAVGELRAAADERARRAELERVKAEGEKVAVELQATEQRKRRRVQLMLAAAVAVLLFGGGAAAWWQDRQATAREIARLEKVSEAERKVNLALANADQLAALSAPFDLEMVAGAESAAGQWRQAEAAVEQAEGVATTAGDRELMRRVAEKAAVIRAGLEGAESAKIRAQRDVEFVAALESAWALSGRTLMVADRSADLGRVYTQALESFGIPSGGTAEAMATAFRSERKSVREVLIPALDRWHELAPPGEWRNRLRTALDLADTDPFRREIRAAVTAKDRAALLRLAGRVESDSLPAMTVCHLGGALQSVQEHDAAVKFLRAGRDRFPDDFWVTQVLVGALFASGTMNNTIAPPGGGQSPIGNSKRADEMIGCVRTAVALRPRSGEAYLGLGLILYMTADLIGAEAACRRAVALDPKSVHGHHFLGSIYLAKSDWDRAEAAFRSGLEIDPLGILAVQLHTNIGMCRSQKRDFAGAAAAYRKAIEVDPKSLIGHLSLGSHLMMTGDWVGVLSAYRKALELSPDTASLHSMMGMALMLTEKFAEAEAEYREAIRLDPKDVRSHIGLGELLRRRKDWGGAEAAYREAIRLDPKEAHAQENLGRLLQSRGQLDAAIPAYNEALRLDPQNAALRGGLKKVERMGKLLPRLPDILDGNAEPKSPAETCEFAYLCIQPFQKRYLGAARLFGKAFAAEPKLADDSVAQHRYNSACCAALAGRGEGLDAPSDPAKRSALRAEALAWLSADLTQYKKRAASPNAAERGVVTAMLTHWLNDSDFNGTRPGLLRIGIPAVERAEWDAFWADVKATLSEARKPAPAPRPKG